jgi:hypothetical protein
MRATILSPLKIIYPRAQNRIYIRRQLDLSRFAATGAASAKGKRGGSS